ncbi:hypothetical protein [Thiolapillus sp.]
MSDLLLALFLPPALGIAWLSRYWKNAHWAAVAGYGYLLGIFATTLFMRLWDASGLELSFHPLAAILGALTLAALWKRPGSHPLPPEQIIRSRFRSAWEKGLFWLLAGLLLLQFGGILLEIIWRPLFPWDAWMNWAPKARVWFESRELLPWVSRADWLHLAPDELAYTLGNPKASLYPPLVPLVQTWMALGLNEWNDSLINLPWWFCSLALGMGLYGQARNAGISPLYSMVLVFGLLSMPYLGTHTALAGYADLWLSAFFGLAAVAFFLWVETRNPLQLALAVLLAIGCTQIKVPGIVWAALLVPAWLTATAPRTSIITMMAAILFLAWAWISRGISIDLPLAGTLVISPQRVTVPGIDSFAVEYHPVWQAFWKHYLVRDNWHLFAWIFPLAVAYAALSNRFSPRLLPATVLVAEAFLFLFITFFFTYHYAAALDGTTINRATLHMMPMLFFYLLLLFRQKGMQDSSGLEDSRNR